MRAKIFCSCQNSSTACSRAGRSTWAGTWRYWGCGLIGGFLRRTPAVFSVRGRELGSRGTTLLGGEDPPPPRGVALPVLLVPWMIHGLSSGGSGVIFTSCTPPGFHRPRVAAGCVRRYSSRQCLSLGPVYGAVPTPADRIYGNRGAGRATGAVRRCPALPPRRVPALAVPSPGPSPRRVRARAVTRMASGRVPCRPADYRPGSGAQPRQTGRPGPGGGTGRAVRPVAAWRVAIYRSRHDSRTKSHR